MLRPVIRPVGEHPQKCLLREILPFVQITCHPGAKPLDGNLPSQDQFAKRCGIPVLLHAPHGLFVTGYNGQSAHRFPLGVTPPRLFSFGQKCNE